MMNVSDHNCTDIDRSDVESNHCVNNGELEHCFHLIERTLLVEDDLDEAVRSNLQMKAVAGHQEKQIEKVMMKLKTFDTKHVLGSFYLSDLVLSGDRYLIVQLTKPSFLSSRPIWQRKRNGRNLTVCG